VVGRGAGVACEEVVSGLPSVPLNVSIMEINGNYHERQVG